MDLLPHPLQSDQRMSCSVLSVHRSFPLSLCVSTNEEPLYQRCVWYELQVVWHMFGNSVSGVFSWIVCTHWQRHFQQNFLSKKLHCTFLILLRTAVASQEHADRFWDSPYFLFCLYPGVCVVRILKFSVSSDLLLILMFGQHRNIRCRHGIMGSCHWWNQSKWIFLKSSSQCGVSIKDTVVASKNAWTWELSCSDKGCLVPDVLVAVGSPTHHMQVEHCTHGLTLQIYANYYT